MRLDIKTFVKLTHWKDVAEHSTHRPLAGDDAGHKRKRTELF